MGMKVWQRCYFVKAVSVLCMSKHFLSMKGRRGMTTESTCDVDRETAATCTSQRFFVACDNDEMKLDGM